MNDNTSIVVCVLGIVAGFVLLVMCNIYNETDRVAIRAGYCYDTVVGSGYRYWTRCK